MYCNLPFLGFFKLNIIEPSALVYVINALNGKEIARGRGKLADGLTA